MGYFQELALLLLLRFFELYEWIFGVLELHLEMIVGSFRGPRRAFSGLLVCDFEVEWG